MSDLFEDPRPGENAPELTVSEISGSIKRVLEGEFGRVRIRGEVGRVFPARTGHLYFDLKDDRSVLAAVSWKGQVARLTVKPEEGMEVVATGRITTFGNQSKYQLNVDDIRPAGVGALMAMLDKRRKALEAEGLFAAARKQPLPYLPEIIGVVTSPSGAVIRDILHRLRDRFPRKVLIWPVAVQGDRCAPDVTRAIQGFNALPRGGRIPRPDLIIVARGGGSVEDLWGFNEESVVRAAAASAIPLISAVGHETDTTLIDHAADQRAPTPTAAAEMAVPVRLELLQTVEAQGARLARAAAQGVGLRQQRLRDLARALPRPENLADSARQRLDLTGDRLPRALTGLAQRRRASLDTAAASLRPQRLAERTAREADRLASLAHRLDAGLTRATQIQRASLERAALRLPQAARSAQARQSQRLGLLGARLSLRPLTQDITRQQARLTTSSARLPRAIAARHQEAARRLTALDRLRKSFDHGEVLKRGFVLVRDAQGALRTRKEGLEPGAPLSLSFADGELGVVTAGEGPAPTAPAKPKAKPARKAAPPDGDQGSLF